jgi:hypothetical protein
VQCLDFSHELHPFLIESVLIVVFFRFKLLYFLFDALHILEKLEHILCRDFCLIQLPYFVSDLLDGLLLFGSITYAESVDGLVEILFQSTPPVQEVS